MSKDEKSKDEKPKSLAPAICAFTLFVLGNIGLNEFNSWALREKDTKGDWLTPGFDFPVFYSMFHQIVCASATYMLAYFAVKPELGPPSFSQLWHYKFALVPIALCSTLNTGLNNMSLAMVSLFVNQTLKAMQPLPTTFFSWLFAGKKYSPKLVATVACIVLGSVLASFYKISQSTGKASSVVGVVLCTISMLAAALRPVIAMMVMTGTEEHPKLNPTVVLCYDASMSFVFMCIYWLASNERQGSMEYLADDDTRPIAITIIVVGSLVAFVFNLATYYFVSLTSALTTVIVSNSIKIVLLIVSAIQVQVSDPTSWTGISITALAIAYYAYQSAFPDATPPPGTPSIPVSAFTDAEKGSKPTEKTPLRAP